MRLSSRISFNFCASCSWIRLPIQTVCAVSFNVANDIGMIWRPSTFLFRLGVREEQCPDRVCLSLVVWEAKERYREILERLLQKWGC